MSEGKGGGGSWGGGGVNGVANKQITNNYVTMWVWVGG